MPTKTYRCACPVCRTLHDVHATFLSSPDSFTIDGVSYPSHSCGNHTAVELRAAYVARHAIAR